MSVPFILSHVWKSQVSSRVGVRDVAMISRKALVIYVLELNIFSMSTYHSENLVQDAMIYRLQNDPHNNQQSFVSANLFEKE